TPSSSPPNLRACAPPGRLTCCVGVVPAGCSTAGVRCFCLRFSSERMTTMNRREVLRALGATAVGLTAATGGKVYADEKGAGGEHDEMGKRTAKSCSDCANACNAGFHHCHQQLAAGKKE